METYADESRGVLPITPARSQGWVHHVINLLDAAIQELNRNGKTAHGTILKAAALLQHQIDPSAPQPAPDGRGRLQAWQAIKVQEYIDRHIAASPLVSDLSVLVHLSNAHFSRAFRRTFGETPHRFLIRRRLEFAAQYMLQTEMPLTDIALKCGFADQPHFSKHFRRASGLSPSAWRRASTTSISPRRS